MNFQFHPATLEDALAICGWQYPEPYATYSGKGEDPAAIAYLVDPANRIFPAIDEVGDVVGFFSFGTDAQVPGGLNPAERDDPEILDVGLGLRPDLTGRGLGRAFVEAGLDFARVTFAPTYFRLAALAWNERAIRVYERVGFTRERIFTSRSTDGGSAYLLMMCLA